MVSFTGLRQTIRKALDMPWAAQTEILRKVTVPAVWAHFAIHGIRWTHDLRIYGMPMVQRYRGSRILFGRGVQLRSWKTSNPLVPHNPVVLATRSRDAEIRIGDGTGLTGATIVAAELVSIGSRVAVGANALIIDTDFHHLDPEARLSDPTGLTSAPIIIEDDVFVGTRAIILKGVHIGAGAVIGAGSVVTRDVEPRAIVAGNPARALRHI